MTERASTDILSKSMLFYSITDVCAAVNGVANVTELFEVSLKKIMELFGASRGSIFILAENEKDLVLQAARGLKLDERHKLNKQIGEGIIGQVAQSKKPIVVADIANDKRFANFKSRKNYKTASFICAPLMIKDHLVGVITLTDKISGHRFQEEEMQVVDFLSMQIALNFRRIKLYEQLQDIRTESDTLRDKLGESGRERENLKRQIYIQEKLASIGKLAGGIAHEFNNPLDGVMRYTNLCLELVRHDEVVRGYLLEIKQGLNRMANIVKNLLACSRQDFLKKEKIGFPDVVNRCLSLLENDLNFRQITVEQDIDKSMLPIWDLGIERILTNILRNAIDAIDKKGIIKIKAAFNRNHLIISVTDTGSGISPENLDKIFDPFFTTKDIDKGCGLGLTIVGEVVKAYEGEINVESQLYRGTTFTISLPKERVL